MKKYTTKAEARVNNLTGERWCSRTPLKKGQQETTSTPEAVKSAPLPLESIHHIHSRHSFTPGVLGVCHGITDHILQENLEHTASFFIDQTTDSLHTSPPCQPPNSGLSNTLDVIPQHFAVPLSSSLPQTLASLPTARHDEIEENPTQRQQTAIQNRQNKYQTTQAKGASTITDYFCKSQPAC
jgi:hypothetical protein